MKVSYVTVCVNYIDFLAISLAHNRGRFDEMIVVTDTKDKDTHDFCEFNHIKYVKTDSFYVNGNVFNKGLALNYGLAALDKPEWVAIMDADTFVPDDIWQKVDLNKLNVEYFYGCERILLPKFEDYYALFSENKRPEDFESPEGFGYGYFQLFHWQSKVIQSVPPGHCWYPPFPDCRESDWMFRLKWGDFDGSHAKWKGLFDKLPIKVFNLGEHGKNHFGRVTEKFI
jgi:hypothetical protein